MNKTSESKFPGRVTALNTSDRAITAITAAQNAISANRNKKEVSELAEKEASSLSPAFKKLLLGMVNGNEQNALDDVRVNTCVAVLGIRQNIAQHIVKFQKEKFAEMSLEECNEALQETVKLHSQFASMFPVTK